MTFSITQKTLERVEWHEVLARLHDFARTPWGRGRLVPPADDDEPEPHSDETASHGTLFETSRDAALLRLAETSEARAILASGDLPPLSGAADLSGLLARARKGGVLGARELIDVRVTLAAIRSTRRFLSLRSQVAPHLADHASAIADLADLERDIEDAIDPSGEVRDSASVVLAEVRADTRRLEGEIQKSLARILRDSSVSARLSDQYFTIRHDRYVLPVRADARGGFRGIVHDASSSGTTLFIEPEELVDLNNRKKQAEMAVERETMRILRALSVAAAAALQPIEAAVEIVATVDVAFARAHLADEMDAVHPEVLDGGVLILPQLRHPLIPIDQCVANDVRLGLGAHVLVLSGPNAGGKTVTMKAMALAALFVRCGLHVAAAPGARVDLFDAIHADIGDEQDIRESLSTFSAHMANLGSILASADARSLVVLDEVGVGTDPGEGAAIAQASLEALADAGARVVTTTHYNLLKEMADVDSRFENASVEFDERTLEPTYRLRLGTPGASSATAVAARMGVPDDVVDRATALLEREDRQLDRMLSELSASRAALEREQREASAARAQGEGVRAEYGARLEALNARREKLYHAMREDLDSGFRDAHAQIAAVIRELQHKGTAQDAAHARERLQTLAKSTRTAAREAGFEGKERPAASPIDWATARTGDRVRVEGGSEGVLLALPDKRGRVELRQGSARVVVRAERVTGVVATARDAKARRGPSRTLVSLAPESSNGTSAETGRDAGRCDLRGLRVDEAIDELTRALDHATSTDRPSLLIVHGVGTGALREAVHRYLRESPYVAKFAGAEAKEGGDGATLAHFTDT